MKATTKLREALRSGELIITPGVYDCLTARLAEMAGFPVVKLLGNVTCGSILGLPDLGLIGLAEMAGHAKNVAAAVEIPVMVDADTGYSAGALGIARTVREFERAGVAGIGMEDQVTPKKCALIPGGTPVVPLDEQLKKLQAAVEARQDPDFVISARTDAESVNGLDDALRRIKAYEAVAADMVGVALPWMRREGMRERTLEALKRIRDAVRVPVNCMFMDEAIQAGNVTLEELQRIGFNMGGSNAVRYTVVKAVSEMLAVLKKEGSTRSYAHRLATLKEYEAVVRLPEFLELEKRYTA
ncbi:MAG TPA: isocitrate lyase/PEP mutase family protein [candidate division Zixibacteria bacterium]|nr:isocitrate lyase/PEP mutase family protein [candidate division Zixibacteria bacterium]